MLFSLAIFLAMIIASLLYGSDLGWAALGKYWLIYLVGSVAIGLLIGIPFILVVFQLGVVLALLVEARMPRPMP